MVRFETTHGGFTLDLDAEKAPESVANFLQYVDDGFFDSTIFHRVIPGFMVQGGGMTVDFDQKKGRAAIKNEAKNGLKNERGTIAMARTNDPNSATAQFFINVNDNAMLDYPSNGGYAVFGKVVEGMDVVDKIKAVTTGTSALTMKHPVTGEKKQIPSTDVPAEKVVITSATAE